MGNAVAILTDAEKRKSYDLYGSEENQRPQHRRAHYQYGYSRGFEADVTAEELFNMFFGGGSFPQQNMYSRQRRYRNNQANQEQEVNVAGAVFRWSCQLIWSMVFFCSIQ